MPNLNQQETVAILSHLRFLFREYRLFLDESEEIEGPLVEKTFSVLTRFVSFLSDSKKNEREIGLWSSIVVTLWKEVIDLDWDSRFQKHLNSFFFTATSMMLVESHTVRKILQEFMEKIGAKYFPVASRPSVLSPKLENSTTTTATTTIKTDSTNSDANTTSGLNEKEKEKEVESEDKKEEAEEKIEEKTEEKTEEKIEEKKDGNESDLI